MPADRTPIAARPFIALIWVYRVALAPLIGGHCRFEPTCSQYGIDAYRRHGALRGTLLTARRILRCHPFSAGGYDPVPIKPEGDPAPPADDANNAEGVSQSDQHPDHPS